MFEGNTRYHRKVGSHHIRGIEPTTEADFKDVVFGHGSRKMIKCQACPDLEERETVSSIRGRFQTANGTDNIVGSN